MGILLKLVNLILILYKSDCTYYNYLMISKTYSANNCIWLILDILQAQMPSINDLMIKVIEKEMSHIDEFNITVIISLLKMVSKVCLIKMFYVFIYVLLYYCKIIYYY